MVIRFLKASIKSAAKLETSDLAWEIRGQASCKEVFEKLHREGWDVRFVQRVPFDVGEKLDRMGLERVEITTYQGAHSFPEIPRTTWVYIFTNSTSGKATAICDLARREFQDVHWAALILKLKIQSDFLNLDDEQALTRFNTNVEERRRIVTLAYESLKGTRPYVYEIGWSGGISSLKLYDMMQQYKIWNDEQKKAIALDLAGESFVPYLLSAIICDRPSELIVH